MCLPLDQFAERVSVSGRYCSYCRSCQSNYCKQHYASNKAAHNSRRYVAQRKARKGLRKLIDSAKCQPCTDCGKKFEPFDMDFDHRDPTTKCFAIGDAVNTGRTLEEVRDEIGKCDIVCAVCHRYRTFGK